MDTVAASADGNGAGALGICPNCGAGLAAEARFCPACGQKRDGLDRPLLALLGDTFGSLFALDGRLMRTLGALLIRPGTLTRRYLDGERQRFVAPFRLFLFTTLVFFALVSLQVGDLAPQARLEVATPTETETEIETGAVPGAETGEEAQGEAAGYTPFMCALHLSVLRGNGSATAMAAEAEAQATSSPPPSVPAPPSAPAPAPVCAGFTDKIRDRDLRTTLSDLPAWARAPVAANLASLAADPQLLLDAFLRHLPKAAFLLVPALALLLALLHPFKRGVRGIDHLVTALHLLTARMMLAILAFGAALLLDELAWAAAGLAMLWTGWATLKRAYGTGWGTAALRLFLLDAAGIVLAVMAVLLMGALALMLG